jgi:hypothetical protein
MACSRLASLWPLLLPRQLQEVCYQKHTNLRLQWPSGQCETERRLWWTRRSLLFWCKDMSACGIYSTQFQEVVIRSTPTKHPNLNAGFAHLQIDWNPLLGATAPRSAFTLPSVLSWICWTPPDKIPGYATVQKECIKLRVVEWNSSWNTGGALVTSISVNVSLTPFSLMPESGTSLMGTDGGAYDKVWYIGQGHDIWSSLQAVWNVCCNDYQTLVFVCVVTNVLLPAFKIRVCDTLWTQVHTWDG